MERGSKKPAEKARPIRKTKRAMTRRQAQGSEQKPEDIEKDVESKLFGSGKPEEEAKRLKRLYEASSKEGRSAVKATS
jgi:ATP-dependent protease ClpP protease subunit